MIKIILQNTIAITAANKFSLAVVFIISTITNYNFIN